MQKKKTFFLIFILFFLSVFAEEEKKDWETLENKKSVISKIEIKISNVFDLTQKEENHLLGKVANAVHIETKPSIIKGFLLFKEGDLVNFLLIYESERILGELNWVKEAYITLKIEEENRVTAIVYVQDA